MKRFHPAPWLLSAFWLLGSAVTTAAQNTTDPVAAHAAEVASWRADRDGRLRRTDGWLTLAGLYWLAPGKNSVGGDKKSDVVLPAAAPAEVGTIEVSAGHAVFVAKVPVLVDDREPTGPVQLKSDREGAPTLLRIGAITFHLIDRDGKLGIRIKDSESPILRNFRGIDAYPASLAWRLSAHYEPYGTPKKLKIPSAQGTLDDEESPGFVEFTVAGQNLRLDALRGAEEGGEIFLIFGDATNGKETYGAGRFLYATVAGDRLDRPAAVTIDFNFAYSPPCAFTPYATCPLPPPQNVLPIRIEAGEKTYDTHTH